MQLSKNQHLSLFIDKTVKILSKTVGRDKVIRFWQYLSLFLAYTKFGSSPKTVDLENPKWGKAHTELRTARKVLRFLRTMQFSKKIITAIKQMRNNPKEAKIDKLINISGILSNLGTVLFFLFDHRVFLAEIGILDQKNLKTNFNRSFVFWFFECLFAIIRDLLKYIKIKRKGLQQVSESEKKQLQSDISEISLDIIKNLGDCLIALSQLSQNVLKPQQIGALGVITSLIGLHQMYESS